MSPFNYRQLDIRYFRICFNYHCVF